MTDKIKSALITASTGIATLATAAPVHAQLLTGISRPSTGFTDFGDLIRRGIDLVFVVAAVAVLLYLFWGAFTYLTAGDNEDNVGAARKRITNAVIGLIIVAAAYALWRFIIGLIPGLQSLVGVA